MRIGTFLRIPWDFFVLSFVAIAFFVLILQKLYFPDLFTFIDSTEPGAVSLASMLPRDTFKNSDVVDMGCLGSKSNRYPTVSLDEGMLRVRGKMCGSKKAQFLSHIAVKNETNGYEGTVFFQGKGRSFTTDYVLLEEGENLIRVEWESKGELLSSTFSIVFKKVN